jgi:hypothetical protein
MSLRRYSRAFVGACQLALVALSLVVVRPQLHLFGGLSRFVLSFLAAALLLYVVRVTIKLARTSDRVGSVVAIAPLIVRVPLWQTFPDGFNPDEPRLPIRFQRPPPSLFA